jgi:hypothetical protein
MPDGTSKTDAKDAASVFDLLRQGKFFLPVDRDPELKAAYRLMQRHMALDITPCGQTLGTSTLASRTSSRRG